MNSFLQGPSRHLTNDHCLARVSDFHPPPLNSSAGLEQVNDVVLQVSMLGPRQAPDQAPSTRMRIFKAVNYLITILDVLRQVAASYILAPAFSISSISVGGSAFG